MKKLEANIKAVAMEAAKKMHGFEKRAFMAKITIDMLNGSERKAEREFGWWREAVKMGMNELESNIRCVENYKFRGAKRTELKNPQLAKDIREIVEPCSQADPTFHTTLAYTRITAKGVREMLIKQKGYQEADLPCQSSFNNILNRMGYSLKRVRKCKPLKKDTRN